MNVLLSDLIGATGPFVAHALNEMPEPVRQKIVDAHAAGSWCELRVGLMNEAASVRLMLVNVDGSATEICKVDHFPT
ncbi:hypothetical protein [Variovorax sp. PvP013]|uniref:hypothetical protein n=1 Tax=Variovorax sp. PvP013 TaxID=3156435 RepID=UPI003D1E4BA5